MYATINMPETPQFSFFLKKNNSEQMCWCSKHMDTVRADVEASSGVWLLLPCAHMNAFNRQCVAPSPADWHGRSPVPVCVRCCPYRLRVVPHGCSLGSKSPLSAVTECHRCGRLKQHRSPCTSGGQHKKVGQCNTPRQQNEGKKTT